ncbi:MAG: glycosyltransferase [Candidatus Moranbacteria bacterium]|jgi:GT2 family glycosyltransferase/glycosyltransferase involved in cell wall biosynthesis|nr:glycosyltransferase [Candidatus Moranbacteria bacterium]
MEEKDNKRHVGFLTERMLRGFGVDVVIDRTAKELVKNGFEVTVFCINTDGTYKNKDYKIIQICSGLHHNQFKTERSARKALKRLNCETDIDIWIAETYPFFLATRIMDKPVIVVDHGVVLTKGLHFLRRIIFAYIKFMQNYLYFTHAAKVVNISRFTQSLTPKLLRKNQTVIYNGADNYKYPSDDEITEFRKKHGIKADDFVLLYVGRINPKNQPYKGTRELVESFRYIKKKHPKVKLIIAGFGDENDRKWLESEGVIPFICADDNTLALLYSVTNCYATASKWEGFNLPLVEAAHFSVPCVAYNAGAHREVVDEKSGFLVNSRKEFVTRIDEIVADKEKRQIMARNAKENASRFLWSKAGLEYKQIIKEIFSSEKQNLNANRRKQEKYDQDIVDVITLNFNGKKYLEPLFNSLRKQTYNNIRVTMVDNGSDDGSADYVINKFPWVNVIRSKKNLFFSRGNNLAVSKTKGEYIFFVNNDVILERDAIQNLIDTMKEKGKYNIASIAAKMLFCKNKKIIDSAGVVMTSNGAPFNRGVGQIDIGQYGQIEEIFGACFGAVLVRRNVYENIIGPLDNSYFGYFEDVDWSFRARIFGYKSYFCPNAIIYHDHSGTSKKLGYEWKYYLIHRNFLKTIIKNFKFKGMLFKGGRKTLELINHLRKTDNSKRRWSIIKILAHITFSLPGLIKKRIIIQSKRCVSDHECIKFSEGEYSFFDAVNYEPILTLDTLEAMFARLDMIKNFKNTEVSEIVSRITYLNERKMMIEIGEWEKRTTKLIESLEKYIGKDYVEKFIDAIIDKKIWKKI